MLSDIEIASQVKLKKIKEIANDLGIDDEELELYGHYKAKISLDIMKRSNDNGKLILVTAINPTSSGEGKTTVSVGLAQGLNKIGKKAVLALREPSLGPVMGIKGGATGGGYSQVLPMEDINLHFTGDMHAITTANNLIATLVDNHIYQGNELQIDPEQIVFKRCIDLNDRNLREVNIGMGAKVNGVERKDGFNITVASEIMAILCLATSIDDLKKRIGNIIVGYTYNQEVVYVKDLEIEGAIATILKDAIKPNLVQTTENTPAIIHGGPFANIAHGCNSIIATKTALKLGEYVVTEAGFGADLGAEKFLDIKMPMANLKPDCVVIVVTIRALKLHGNETDLKNKNVGAVRIGIENLAKHIDTIQHFGLPYVVAINHFFDDDKEEIDLVKTWCKDNNHALAIADIFTDGGNGGKDLANLVIETIAKKENNYQPLYDLNDDIETKANKIAKIVYGAKEVVFTEDAKIQLEKVKLLKADKYPICMAKTPNSLSDNPKLLGRPTDFTITVKEVRINNGARFIVLLTGKVLTMPGLPKTPSALKINIDNDGKIEGIF